MDPATAITIGSVIAGGAVTLAEKGLELLRLWLVAKTSTLTVEDVQKEVDRIVGWKKTTDAAEWEKLRGTPP